MAKWVKRKSDGAVIDVPDGHWSLTSDEFEEVADPNKPKKRTPAKRKPKAKESN